MQCLASNNHKTGTWVSVSHDRSASSRLCCLSSYLMGKRLHSKDDKEGQNGIHSMLERVRLILACDIYERSPDVRLEQSAALYSDTSESEPQPS